MRIQLPWRLRFHPFLYRKRKFNFYDESAIAADPSKKATYAYAFVVDKNAPTFFVVPGGGYGVVCLSYEGVFIAEEFNRHGINAFVLNYRVGKDAHAPNPQEDLAALISYVFANKERFGIAKEENLEDLSYVIMIAIAGAEENQFRKDSLLPQAMWCIFLM